MIKSFQVYDVFSVSNLQKQGNTLDLVERLVHPRSPLKSALLATVLPASPTTSTFILDFSDESERHQGLIQTRGRSGRPEQDVVFLGPSLVHGNGSHAIWQRLLTHVSVKAGEAGHHRIYARVERDSDEAQIFKNVGFTGYAEEEIFRLDPKSFSISPKDTLGLRKQMGEDSWSLQRLYAAVTPRAVQIAEGLAQGQWQLDARILADQGRRQGYMWEREGEILAALHVRSGRTGYSMRVLIHPTVSDQLEALIEAGMQKINHANSNTKKPIYCTLRTYQSDLGQGLARLNFESIATQMIMVKHTTVRAKDVLSRLVSFETPVEAKPAVPAPFLKSDPICSTAKNGHIAVEKGL